MLKVRILVLHVDGEACVAARAVSAVICGCLVMSERANVREHRVVDRDVCVLERIWWDRGKISSNVRGVAPECLKQVETIDVVFLSKRCVGCAVVWDQEAWIRRWFFGLC